MAEIFSSGEYTSAIGIAIIVLALFFFAHLLEDKQEGDGAYSQAPGTPDGAASSSVTNASVIAAITAAVAEYRRTNT